MQILGSRPPLPTGRGLWLKTIFMRLPSSCWLGLWSHLKALPMWINSEGAGWLAPAPHDMGLSTGHLMAWQLASHRASNPKGLRGGKHAPDGSHGLLYPNLGSDISVLLPYFILYSIEASQKVQPILKGEAYTRVNTRNGESLQADHSCLLFFLIFI